MQQLRLLASNSLIASISINFRSGEAVRVTTNRSGPTGNVPLHENQFASRESVSLEQERDSGEQTDGNECRHPRGFDSDSRERYALTAAGRDWNLQPDRRRQ